MKFEIKKAEPPKIEIDFETIEKNLIMNLSRYEGLVFTDETLKGGKEAVAELNALINQVEVKRKRLKKALFTDPLKVFESDFKRLVELIEDKKKPLKDQIDVFTSAQRAEKEKEVLELINSITAQYRLNETYSARLDLLPKYLNKTGDGKIEKVESDLIARAKVLKDEQESERQAIEFINNTCKKYDIDPKSHIKLYKLTREVIPTISDINDIGRKKLEDAQKEELERVEKELKSKATRQALANSRNEIVEALENDPDCMDRDDPNAVWFVCQFEITDTFMRLKSLGNFMKNQDFDYKILSQEEVGGK